MTVRKYGDLERNSYRLRGLVTSPGQPSTSPQPARRSYIPFAADVACVLTPLVTVALCRGPRGKWPEASKKLAENEPDPCQSIRNLVLWTLTHKPGMPFIPKRLQTCYRGGPLGMHSSRMKGNFHVRFRWGESPTKGPTYPNREYAGICEKQHLTMFMTNRIPTYQ